MLKLAESDFSFFFFAFFDSEGFAFEVLRGLSVATNIKKIFYSLRTILNFLLVVNILEYFVEFIVNASAIGYWH